MKTTKVQKSKLLDTLQANRRKHKEAYDKAMKVWVEKCTKALLKATQKAEQSGKINTTPLSKLPKPESYLDSYDAVIERLKMEVEDIVELDEQEFFSWVLDNWNWRGRFIANSAMYGVSL